jgi:hypothetical protein
MEKLLMTAALMTAAVSAHADTTEISFAADRAMAAPSNAFELVTTTGYRHVAGRLERGVALDEDGYAFELGLGYRFSPSFSLAIVGGLTDYSGGETEGLGLSVGWMSTYHFRPFRTIDPFISGGGGFRAFIVDRRMDEADVGYTGFDLGRLQVGVDFRVTPQIAIAPVIGVDLTMYRDRFDEDDVEHDIEHRRLSVAFFAGLSGRFDLGGREVPAPTTEPSSTQR